MQWKVIMNHWVTPSLSAIKPPSCNPELSLVVCRNTKCRVRRPEKHNTDFHPRNEGGGLADRELANCY